jgi:hypothetical protein
LATGANWSFEMTDEKKDAPQLIYSGDYTKGAIGYCSSGRWAGWIFWKHPDGQWVSLAKIPDRPQPVADDAGGDRQAAWKALKAMVYGGGNIGDDGKDDGGHRLLKGSILFDHWAVIEAALRQPPAVYDPNLSVPDHVIESAQILRIWAANQGHEKWQVMGIGPVDHTPAADNRGVDVEATMSINAIQKAAGVLYDQLQPYMNAKSLGHAPIFMAYSTIMEQTMDLRGLLRTTPEDAKGDEKPEWFFRWAARAMAGHTPYENAISTIFNHPGNPYAENNPWASPQPEHEGEKG